MTRASSTIRLQPVNLAEALQLAPTFTDLAYTQEPGYAAEAAARVGARAEFFAFGDGSTEPAGLAALRVKEIPLLGGGLAYLHGGPAMLRVAAPPDAERWAACVGALAERCAARRLTLRITAPPGLAGAGDHLRRLGFALKGVDEGRTIWLDLAPDLETLRSTLDGKWRTDLRRGERSDLRVVRSAAPEAIAKLQPLLAELARSKGFGVDQDARFFARAANYPRDDAPPPFVAHLACAGKELVGGHIGAFTGDTAVYLLGATNAAGRETRAAFVLQWAVIEYARERGLARYDLGGIDPAANPLVYRFKARMGGREVDRGAVWERRSGALRPALIALAERARR